VVVSSAKICATSHFFHCVRPAQFTLWVDIFHGKHNDIYFEKFGSGAFSWGEAARRARTKWISVPYCFSPPL